MTRGTDGRTREGAVVNAEKLKRIEANRDAILASARREVESKGILGLRVAEVAEGAHTSITQIYRFFTDRNGLLAQVLGDMYEEFHDRAVRLVVDALPGDGPLTVEMLAHALPSPTDAYSHRMHEHRMQIMAASVTNPELKARLTVVTESAIKKWEDVLAGFQARMAPGETFDPGFVVMFFGLQNPYLWEIMGTKAFTATEYRSFLVRHLTV